MRAARLLLARLVLVLLLPTTWAAHAEAPSESPAPLSFQDFFQQQDRPGQVGLRYALGNRPQALDGQWVTIEGYMVRTETPSRGRFRLTSHPVQINEHSDGASDDLPPATLWVLLSPDQADWVVPHQSRPMRLTGRLSVGREEHSDGQVSWFRLQLPSGQTKTMSPWEYWAALASQQPHRH